MDELRRGIEALPAETYDNWAYYEKWAASMASVLIENAVLDPTDFDEALGLFSYIFLAV